MQFVSNLNPQASLGVFLTLSAFDRYASQKSAGFMFHRIYPSVANGQYLLMQDETSEQFVGAAAWYLTMPMHTALVVNNSRPLTAAEARSGTKDCGNVFWHTFLTPYGDAKTLQQLAEVEIRKLTQVPASRALLLHFDSGKLEPNLMLNAKE